MYLCLMWVDGNTFECGRPKFNYVKNECSVSAQKILYSLKYDCSPCSTKELNSKFSNWNFVSRMVQYGLVGRET